MKTSHRNLPVDAIKGLMILLIIFHHSCLLPFLHHGYLGVDVFFMISGFYLMKHFSYHKETTAVHYLAKRLQITYLPYLLSFLLASILDIKRLMSFDSFEGFVETFAPLVSFLTLTEGLEFPVHGPIILTGGWFLSVLLIGGFLLYGLLEYNERLSIKVLLPVGIIAGFNFLFSQNKLSVESWYAAGAVSLPLLRGVIDMGMGILLFDVIQNNFEWLKLKSKIITFLSLVSLGLFFIMTITQQPLDCLLVIIIPLMLLGVLIPNTPIQSFYRRLPMAFLPQIGKLSLEMFLIHYPTIHIVHSGFKFLGLPLNPLFMIPSDVIAIIIAAVVLHWVCRMIYSLQSSRVSS